MKLLCDEGVEKQIVSRLRNDGHEVLYVAEMSPGISDDEILGLSRGQGAVLITNDKDFGELVFRQGLVTYGVLLLRLPGLESEEKASVVSGVIVDHAKEMVGAFSVINRSRLRIRSQLSE